MINKRNLYIILLFFLITLTVLVKAFSVRKSIGVYNASKNLSKTEKTIFKKLNYFSIKNGNKDLRLNAEKLEILTSSANKIMDFDKPIGILHEKNRVIDWNSDNAKYTQKGKLLELVGNAHIVTKDGKYDANKIYYIGKKGLIEAKDNVIAKVKDLKTLDTLTIYSNYMTSWIDEKRTVFLGDVKGQIDRKLQYESGVKFSSQRLEYQQLKSLMTLYEEVSLDRNNYHIESRKAEIYLENYNKKLKYYVLYDDIKLEEDLLLPDGSRQKRKAFSERLEGFMSEGKTLLSGSPRVEQGDDVIKGYLITLRENVDIIEVDDSKSSFRLKKDN